MSRSIDRNLLGQGAERNAQACIFIYKKLIIPSEIILELLNILKMGVILRQKFPHPISSAVHLELGNNHVPPLPLLTVPSEQQSSWEGGISA